MCGFGIPLVVVDRRTRFRVAPLFAALLCGAEGEPALCMYP